MSEKTPEDANSGNESDQDFDPSAEMLVNDFDDEGTLAEEEALEAEATSKEEIDALEEEGNIPIEELLKRYYGGSQPPPSADDDDGDDDDDAVREDESVTSSSVTGNSGHGAAASSTSHGEGANTGKESGSKPKTIANYFERDYSSSEDEYEDASVATWKRSIQVGENFQARIPPLQDRSNASSAGGTTSGGSIKTEHKNKYPGEKLLWKPTNYLSSRQIDEYLIEYAKVSLDDDVLCDVSLLTLPEGVHIKDDEQALFVLFRCQYNITEALQMHELKNEPRAPIKEMMSPWSEEECRAFENGMRSYGKDFFQIKQNRIPTRSVGETVEFYYFWKKTERHDIYINKYEKEKKKYALHPGLTDYMDRFLDEQENLSSGAASNSPTVAALQALSGAVSAQVSSSDNHHHVGSQSRQASSSSSAGTGVSSVLPHNLFMGNSSVTITAHHSPVKTINVSGDRTQTILINKEKDTDKHHHHQQYNNHGMSIMAGNRKQNQNNANDVTTTILTKEQSGQKPETGSDTKSTLNLGNSTHLQSHQNIASSTGSAMVINKSNEKSLNVENSNSGSNISQLQTTSCIGPGNSSSSGVIMNNNSTINNSTIGSVNNSNYMNKFGGGSVVSNSQIGEEIFKMNPATISAQNMILNSLNKPGSISSINSSKSRESMGSVGFGQNIAQTTSEDQTIQYRSARLIQIIEIDKQPSFPCYDCVVLLLTCKSHQRVATKNFYSTSKIFWLPFLANIGTRLHSETLQKMLYTVLQSHDGGLVPTRTLQEINYSTQLIDIVSIENQYGVWSKRYTYWVHIKECVKDVCSPDHNSKIEWRFIDNILANANHCWGRDMLRMIEKIKPYITGPKTVELPFDIREFPYQANFPSGILDHKTDSYDNIDQFVLLFQSAKLNAPRLKDLYKDYRKHTYPSLDMNYPCLDYYLHKYGFVAAQCGFGVNYKDKICPLKSLYHSALLRPGRTREDSEFGFQNLCYLILAMDPNCSNDNARCWLLFNLYSGNTSYIDDKNAKMFCQDIGIQLNTLRIDFPEFQKLYFDSRYNKLQSMLRFKKSIFEQLDAGENTKGGNDKSLTSKRESIRHGQGTCESCKANNYAMSTHTYMVNQDGHLVNQRPVELDRIENLNDYARYSKEITNYERSLPNLVRSFLTKNEDNMNFYGLLIIQLCENLEHLLGKKSKIVKVRSPTIIIPELHGNFDYLRSIEREFAPLRPENETGMIFLGNYIGAKDKQTRSVDVISYLFALKMLDVNRVVLLRGLQESAKTIPKLMKECNQKFESLGEQVYNAIVSVLESLPYVAIVNETICCLPSGFPKEAAKTSLFHFFETINSSSIHVTRDVLTQFCKSRPNDLVASNPRIRSKPSNRSRKSNRKSRNKQTKVSRSRSLLSNAGPSASASTVGSNSSARRKSVPNIDENIFYQFLTNNQFNHLIRSGDASESFSIAFNKRCFTLAANELKSNAVQSCIMSIDGALNLRCISFTYDPAPKEEGVRRTQSCVDF